jgi:hypothetical protein
MNDLTFLFDVEEWFKKNGRRVNIQRGLTRRIRLNGDKFFYNNEHLLKMSYTQAEIDSAKAIEPARHREAVDWSYLNGKVVGAESG